MHTGRFIQFSDSEKAILWKSLFELGESTEKAGDYKQVSKQIRAMMKELSED